MADQANPWSVPVAVDQIPEAGLHRQIEADTAERAALAAVAGLREVSSATASLDLTPIGRGKVQVTGAVSARVGQICVVTLDPIENEISETIDVTFVPEADIPELADSVDRPAEELTEIPDPPEPIVDGVIDLGRLAADAIFLGIDPYPRKPGVVFDRPVVAPDPEDHPFAALQALKGNSESPAVKKAKDRRG
jgi:hypothetical protein